MRCLLIAPAEDDLGVLPEILEQAGLVVTSSVDVGAGIALARSDLDSFDAAVVVLPAKWGGKGLAAALVEIGVAAGRGLPLLLFVPHNRSVPAALRELQVVRADLRNWEALSLHIGMFARSLQADYEFDARATEPRTKPLSEQVADAFARQLERLHDLPQAPPDAWTLERLVIELLSSAGADIQEGDREQGEGFDAAAFVPGEEDRLGLLVVEVKSRLNHETLSRAQLQLQSYVMHSNAAIGLLLYLSSSWIEPPQKSAPLVISMEVSDLLNRLRHESLGEVLLEARNDAIHRM